ncbi:MAG: radical SAM protein [Candidatus Omnitrophica bacterium]|nr:radical SAM protein [Candidatus Omnitrophota bacterium]
MKIIRKVIALIIIQFLLLSNCAWAKPRTMLSPRIFVGADQFKLIFSEDKTGNTLAFDQVKTFGLFLNIYINSILNIEFENFEKNQEYYYKAYMQIREVIFKHAVDEVPILNHLRSLSQETEDLLRRKFYLMVWAKLMEDHITDSLPDSDPREMPRYLTLCLTEKCNAGCRFCLAKANGRYKENLSISQIKEILLDAKSAGVYEIRFMGGELSLVREELLETMRIAGSLGLRSGLMFTNGWWIDQPWAEKFMIELAEAQQKKSPAIMLSVDKVHQQHIPLKRILKFIEKYFTLFPGASLYLHTYVTNEDDELEDLLISLKDKVIETEEQNLRGGIKLRSVKLKKGDLKALYANLLQIGYAESMPQNLYDRYVLEKLAGSDSDDRFANLKFSPSISSERMSNALSISARGEYFLKPIYIPDSILSMGNIRMKSIKEAMRYMNKNPVMETLIKENGHMVLYEKAKEFVPRLYDEIAGCNFLEEALVKMLRDPIARLAINVSLIDEEQLAFLKINGLLSKTRVDLDFIFKIAEENRNLLHAIEDKNLKQDIIVQEAEVLIKEEMGGGFAADHHGLQHAIGLMEKAKELIKKLGREKDDFSKIFELTEQSI